MDKDVTDKVTIETREAICFVVCPIGDTGSETRRRSDQMLRHIIKPIAERFDYKVIRADEIGIPGSISLQLIEMLISADLVIADLTNHNPNVFYELGVRHAFGKPFVQIAEEDETKLPFDIADLRTIRVNHKDLDSVDTCKIELERHINSIHIGEAVRTPITQVVDIKTFEQSDNPDKEIILDVIKAVDSLRQEVQQINSRLTSSDLGNLPINTIPLTVPTSYLKPYVEHRLAAPDSDKSTSRHKIVRAYKSIKTTRENGEVIRLLVPLFNEYSFNTVEKIPLPFSRDSLPTGSTFTSQKLKKIQQIPHERLFKALKDLEVEGLILVSEHHIQLLFPFDQEYSWDLDYYEG